MLRQAHHERLFIPRFFTRKGSYLFVFLLALLAAGCGSQPAPGPTLVVRLYYDQPPPLTIDMNKSYTATLKTEKGDVVVELFPRQSPKTVNNFVFLTRKGFYNETTFHRVIPGFVAQGGDPEGTGSGGPGYTFEDEPNGLRHDAGVISMANRGPNTNGSQFFITLGPQYHLDGRHTIFGRVVKGMDVLQSLRVRDPDTNPPYKGDRLIKVEIAEK